jgi:hypothetical protein
MARTNASSIGARISLASRIASRKIAVAASINIALNKGGSFIAEFIFILHKKLKNRMNYWRQYTF